VLPRTSCSGSYQAPVYVNLHWQYLLEGSHITTSADVDDLSVNSAFVHREQVNTLSKLINLSIYLSIYLSMSTYLSVSAYVSLYVCVCTCLCVKVKVKFVPVLLLN